MLTRLLVYPPAYFLPLVGAHCFWKWERRMGVWRGLVSGSLSAAGIKKIYKIKGKKRRKETDPW